jgi:hypothetical protein
VCQLKARISDERDVTAESDDLITISNGKEAATSFHSNLIRWISVIVAHRAGTVLGTSNVEL